MDFFISAQQNARFLFVRLYCSAGARNKKRALLFNKSRIYFLLWKGMFDYQDSRERVFNISYHPIQQYNQVGSDLRGKFPPTAYPRMKNFVFLYCVYLLPLCDFFENGFWIMFPLWLMR